MSVELVRGDLFAQPVEAIVNPWNCNVLPLWWPSSGVSGQLKRQTRPKPWRELHRSGWLPTGSAVVTGPGEMPTLRAIIHVAGLHPWWRTSPGSVRKSIRAAAAAADDAKLPSVATPLIGAGTGGLSPQTCRQIIVEELDHYLSSTIDSVHRVVVTPPI